jgi:hypothetical protein
MAARARCTTGWMFVLKLSAGWATILAIDRFARYLVAEIGDLSCTSTC